MRRSSAPRRRATWSRRSSEKERCNGSRGVSRDPLRSQGRPFAPYPLVVAGIHGAPSLIWMARVRLCRSDSNAMGAPSNTPSSPPNRGRDRPAGAHSVRPARPSPSFWWSCGSLAPRSALLSYFRLEPYRPSITRSKSRGSSRSSSPKRRRPPSVRRTSSVEGRLGLGLVVECAAQEERRGQVWYLPLR
jgi:hypothetical protein